MEIAIGVGMTVRLALDPIPFGLAVATYILVTRRRITIQLWVVTVAALLYTSFHTWLAISVQGTKYASLEAHVIMGFLAFVLDYTIVLGGAYVLAKLKRAKPH